MYHLTGWSLVILQEESGTFAVADTSYPIWTLISQSRQPHAVSVTGSTTYMGNKSHSSGVNEMDKLNVGIIGLGNMGKNHVRILSNLANCCLIGCYDANQNTTNELAQRYGFQPFASVSELLHEVEAVVVAVPTKYHYEVGKACLEAGVHVLMEKPLCKTIEEAVELGNLAKRLNLVLQVGHIERFNPAIQEFRKLFDPKQVISFWTERLSSFDPRISDADVVEDLMIHDIDLM